MEAKRSGLVEAARPLLEALVENGFRLKDHHITEALKAVGEE